MDCTHAKQNFQELVELLPAGLEQPRRVAKQWKDLLWIGDLRGLYESLGQVLSGCKKTQALKKWRDYFQRDAPRMAYARFRQAAVPYGSGRMESAVRRLNNSSAQSARNVLDPRDGGVSLVLVLPTALRALGYLDAQYGPTGLPVHRTRTRDQPPARTL